MPTVRVDPAGLELEVGPGESLAEAAWRQGYTWPTKCWGQAECMTCFVKVIDGELSTELAGDDEEQQLATVLPPRLRGPLTRLGCRLRVIGPGVVVEKKGVKPPGSASEESSEELPGKPPEP